MGDPAADTAGVPWTGRTLPAGGFDGDDGAPDPALAAALQACAEGSGSDVEVVGALAAARVLVPVVAVAADGERGHQAQSGDAGADMALATLRSPDGRLALPAFSGLASLQRWDPRARPVPVAAVRAALSAVAETCDVLVLDPAGPIPFVVSRPAVWALAQGRPWVPAHQDDEVAAVLRQVADRVPGVVDLQPARGDQAELAVGVLLEPGLDRPAVEAAAAAVAQVLQDSELVRERVDGVELTVRPAP